MSTPINTNPPNAFDMTGHNLHVSYSTTSLDGKPRLTYQDAHQTLSFTGNDIRTVATEIGTLVTVTVRHTIDTGSTSFSFLVPQIKLDASNAAPFHTNGITTIHRFSIVPIFNHGQQEIYTVTPLSGTARFLLF